MNTTSDAKIHSLLQFTTAISKNSPSFELIELYVRILKNYFYVGNVLVCINKEGQWEIRYPGGSEIIHPAELGKYVTDNQIRKIKEIPECGQFLPDYEVLIPVYHKNEPLGAVFLGWADSKVISRGDIDFIQTFTNILMVAIENKRLAKREMERIAINREITLAGEIQKKLLPDSLPDEEHIKVKAFYLPSQEVGGDYYDWIPLNRHEYLFCMADVSGKGVPAALLMSNIQACLRSLTGFTHNLKDIIMEINHRVWQSVKGEQYASMFLGKLNLRSQQLTSINAGHCQPLLVMKKTLHHLEKGCTLLGISSDLGTVEVEIREYTKDIGLFLYTDGLSELYLNSHPVQRNFYEALFSEHYNNPEHVNNQIKKEILFYMNNFSLPDDIAVMSIFVNDFLF